MTTQFGATRAIIGVAALALVSVGFAPTTAKWATRTSTRQTGSAQIQLAMGTLHAAKLSQSRGARDTADAPFMFVTVLGTAKNSSIQMPSASKHWAINLDEAKGAAPLTSLTLASGESMRVLFTLLENDKSNAAIETSAGNALARIASTGSAAVSPATVASTIKPLTTSGTNWIGSATMLVTNEGGKAYWRALDCVEACSVSDSPVQAKGTELTATATSGILELTGHASTYHLKLTAKRVM